MMTLVSPSPSSPHSGVVGRGRNERNVALFILQARTFAIVVRISLGVTAPLGSSASAARPVRPLWSRAVMGRPPVGLHPRLFIILWQRSLPHAASFKLAAA